MNKLKLESAKAALSWVRDGMVLGLGSGSTTAHFVTLLGQKLARGELKEIKGVPTSMATAELAGEWNIPLVSLSENPVLDLAVDGADEVDPYLDLIKGLGRALLREKIVEVHARQFVVIVDESKLVKKLGSKQPLPVEIVPFEVQAHIRWLNTLGCNAELWVEPEGVPAITDNGNYLARCYFPEGIPDPYALARILADRPGIVEHGLFLGMADKVIVAAQTGVQIMERKHDS